MIRNNGRAVVRIIFMFSIPLGLLVWMRLMVLMLMMSVLTSMTMMVILIMILMMILRMNDHTDDDTDDGWAREPKTAPGRSRTLFLPALVTPQGRGCVQISGIWIPSGRGKGRG